MIEGMFIILGGVCTATGWVDSGHTLERFIVSLIIVIRNHSTNWSLT